MLRFFNILIAGFQGRLRIRESKCGKWFYKTVKDNKPGNNLGPKKRRKHQ